MPRPKESEPTPETPLRRLTAAVESASTQLHGIRRELDETHVRRLTEAVEATAMELQTIREVLDDIYSELQWALRNHDRFRGGNETAPTANAPASRDAVEVGHAQADDESPAQPAAPASPPSQPGPPAAPAGDQPTPDVKRPGPRKKKRRPLFERLFCRPHLTALARIIGMNELPLSEVQERIKDLGIPYGSDEIAEAEEILVYDTHKEPPTIRLTDEARKLAAYLDPSPAAS